MAAQAAESVAACECMCCQEDCPCVDPEFNPGAAHPCPDCEAFGGTEEVDPWVQDELDRMD